MKMIFLLSLSGSIVLTCSVLFKRFMDRFSFRQWQEVWIKIAIAFYLISGPVVISIKYLNRKLHIIERQDEPINILISHRDAGILKHETRINVNWAFIIYAIITAVIIMIMFFFLIKKLEEYRNIKKAIMQGVLYKKANIPEEEVEKLKNMINLKKDVRIYLTNLQVGAFTIGYFHPVIVLWEKTTQEKREVILLHEMCHIKRKDILFKFIMTVVVCVHWFNPLVYCLPEMLNRSIELNCDEMVIRHLSPKKKKIYMQEIISQSKPIQREGNLAMQLGGNVNLTKERVVNIMNQNIKSSNKVLKCLMAVLTFTMLVISAIPVCAYEGVSVMDIGGEEGFVREQYEEFSNCDILFSSDGSLLFEVENADIRFEQQFVDEDGTIYKVDLIENGRAGCTHPELISGKYQKHTKNSTGGCVFTIYEAERCKECGHTFVGELISKFEYAKCPH